MGRDEARRSPTRSTCARCEAFEKFKGPKADKQTFLESFPEDKLFLFTDLVARAPGEGKLEDLIKGSDNEGRAEQARKELVALMAKEPRSRRA